MAGDNTNTIKYDCGIKIKKNDSSELKTIIPSFQNKTIKKIFFKSENQIKYILKNVPLNVPETTNPEFLYFRVPTLKVWGLAANAPYIVKNSIVDKIDGKSSFIGVYTQNEGDSVNLELTDALKEKFLTTNINIDTLDLSQLSSNSSIYVNFLGASITIRLENSKIYEIDINTPTGDYTYYETIDVNSTTEIKIFIQENKLYTQVYNSVKLAWEKVITFYPDLTKLNFSCNNLIYQANDKMSFWISVFGTLLEGVVFDV